jgi:hypothetical protein
MVAASAGTLRRQGASVMSMRVVSLVLCSVLAAAGLTFGTVGAGLAQSSNASTGAAPANLGTADYEVPGVQVVLLSLKRGADGFLTLRWAYRNTTASSKTIGANTGAMDKAWSANYSLAWDTYLSAGDTKYTVARVQGRGELMAEKHGGAFASKTLIIAAKQSYATWAKFPDPGAGVTKVTVYIQGAPPFDDVPIS